MTVATTVKLPGVLKRRVGKLAKARGKSAHAWLVDAIETVASQEEQDEAFYAEALESQREVEAGGAVYALDDVLSWMKARLNGKRAARPRPVKR